MLIALEPLISIHLPKGDGAAKLTDAPNGSKQYNNFSDELCAHDPFYATWRNEIRERQAKEDLLPPKWRQERITPQWDKLPDCVKEITKEVFASGATDASTLALVRSMLPRELDIKICDRKGRRHCDISELTPIIDRIKHRRKIAELNGQTLAIFENDRIDESAKADDIALLATLRNGETQTAQAAHEAEQRKNTTNGGGSFCALSQEDYAKELGVSKRTIQRWEKRETTPPCLYDETTQKMVTYSAELRQDPTKAHIFAMNYKTHKRVKRNLHGATQYKAGFTDEANYRIQHGIPKSTQGRKTDYEGEADAQGIAGLRRAVFG